MYDRLILYNNRQESLYEYQFGLQKGKSTDMALITLKYKISEALDQGEVNVSEGYFLISLGHSAFELYGVKDTALKWFDSYLSNRLQYLIHNNI